MRYIHLLIVPIFLGASFSLLTAAENVAVLAEEANSPIVKDLDLNGQLFQAILEDNELLIKELKEKGADINAQDEGGDTALIRSVIIGGPPEYIEKLLKAGAKVNIRNNDNDTVLEMLASYISCNTLLDHDIEGLSNIHKLLVAALQQEKKEEMRAQCKVRRMKEITVLLFCRKNSKELALLPNEVLGAIQQQLIALDEAEIMETLEKTQ